MTDENNFGINGLTDAEVIQSRELHGANSQFYKHENTIWMAIKSLIKEPMVILLLVASCIYFISGKTGDGIFLSSAIVLVATISLYQDGKSRNALEKLKTFSQPKCKVIRNGRIEEILSEDLVIDDCMMVEEGTSIMADGIIIHSNDFSVNESILTGESLAVYKDKTQKENTIYTGTTVASGLAIATITAIGNQTQLGKIGKSLEEIVTEKTPLEGQIGDFVKKMVLAGAVVFLIVWGIGFYRSHNVLDSLLKALTLAMSILPEEIPVAFTTFMALGAWRLMRMGVIVKQMKTVESLGGATVICTDKTGTITENKMTLAKLYVGETRQLVSADSKELDDASMELIRLGMWASEPIPFDPMELALHQAYSDQMQADERKQYHMIHEYPLGGQPPMMTHIFEDNNGIRIIAAKGAPEGILQISNISEKELTDIQNAIKSMAKEGYRILAVGEAKLDGNKFPDKQQDFAFDFKGLVGFYDPPKKNIRSVFENFYKAGISVKIVTGDNAETTSEIARQIGFAGYDKSLTGNELMALSTQELQDKVMHTNIFTRMFPDAKLKIINALKAEGQIVAMTGDGVNDGPALKAAHIGIAMGKRGTEIAKQAASLILLDDDLSKMVDAVAMGRRIYTNLKKAIRYIISIHIPIILTVFIPLAFAWAFPNIFSPIHIIFLELIMGPTCSIIYENEPMEANTMRKKPRPYSKSFFRGKELITSILQGLAITIGTLGIYQYCLAQGYSEDITRTMVFTTLIAANICLTFVNRSFYYSVFTTIRYKNNLILLVIGITIFTTAMLLYINPLTRFFEFDTLNGTQIGLSILVGFAVTLWYEIVKLFMRISNKKGTAALDR